MTSATTIAGRYRIEGRLGVGGMSTVHLAFDDRLERYVALKLLAEHLADDPTFVSRFRREALAAARLVHPNIVQVFDFGFDEASHQHFIVMEHVSGQLVRRTAARPRPSRGRAGGRHHHPGLPRARLRPPQRRRAPRRQARQPARVRTPTSSSSPTSGSRGPTDQSSITQVGSVLGTAAYLSPEQARGEEAGPRADIYSLGVVVLPAAVRPAAL